MFGQRHLTFLLVCLAQLSSLGAQAHILERGRIGCGTIAPPLSVRNVTETYFQANNPVPATQALARLRPTSIKVYFNIISADETREGGNVPDSFIHEQMKVLNKDFTRGGLRFDLQAIKRVVNETWYHRVSYDTIENTEMKEALRIGGPETLNIYTVGFTQAGGLLGYATFPSDYKRLPKDDGVVLLTESLPGGLATDFNLGRTLTHEVGHWVGLYHTFQTDSGMDECDRKGRGDYVFDTPLENGPASGCPIGRDSCPDDRGRDPIANFMDYSQDSCMNEFTRGQTLRLRGQIALYRRIWF
ncbi:metalloprotease [Panaeolus papilionaceus]|nr:metalloprotease [Panaeolus papilionaceus]